MKQNAAKATDEIRISSSALGLSDQRPGLAPGRFRFRIGSEFTRGRG